MRTEAFDGKKFSRHRRVMLASTRQTPSRNRLVLLAVLPLALTACHHEQAPVEAQRIAFDQVPVGGEQPLASPDTKGASWSVASTGQAIDFGRAGEKPWLSLVCSVKAGEPQVTIVRHAPTRPGEKALFPVIGNGTISRFKVDATLAGGEWRWQGTLPADDPQLDAFGGTHEIEATLPGAGTLKIEGSRVPGQFIAWCRGGGKAPQPTVPNPSPSA